MPPGQSSRSVALSSGSEIVTSRREGRPFLLFSLKAATHAAAAWSAWSPGPMGRRMETGLLLLLLLLLPDEEEEEEEEEVAAETTTTGVAASEEDRRSERRRFACALRSVKRLAGSAAHGRGGPHRCALGSSTAAGAIERICGLVEGVGGIAFFVVAFFSDAFVEVLIFFFFRAEEPLFLIFFGLIAFGVKALSRTRFASFYGPKPSSYSHDELPGVAPCHRREGVAHCWLLDEEMRCAACGGGGVVDKHHQQADDLAAGRSGE